jgi:hypothetical protein
MSPSGGWREGAGRKSRNTPKSKGIWCSQITDEQRDFIMQWLSPDDRFSALMAAANKACSGLVESSAPQRESTLKKLSARRVLSKPSTNR